MTQRRKTIGFATAVALVMGNMIGSGIFLLPASLAPYRGLGFAGWIISAAGSIMLALVFARLVRQHPVAGGPYAFTRIAFGDLVGFLVAWGYWISIWCGNAGIAIAFVGYLEPFFPTFVNRPDAAALLAIGAVWLLTVVNLIGVHEAGQVQTVTTVLKIVPLVVIGIAGLFYANLDHFVMSTSDGGGITSALAGSAALTFWAFGGLESATIPADSIERPDRTIPRATIVGTIVCAVIYIVSTAGVMAVIAPSELATAPAPFADAAGLMLGPWAARFVAAGAAIACFGALNGWILIGGQMPLALANDGLFPKVFGARSPSGSPVVGLIVSSVLTTILIVLNKSGSLVGVFTFIILLGTLSALVPYALSAVAGMVLERRHSAPAGPSSRVMIVAALAFVYSIWAIVGSGWNVIGWGLALLAAGLPVYFLAPRRRQ